MNYFHVNYSRGQMKIQQMAFVLVALMIFLSMVALFYINIRTGSLRQSVTDLEDEQAKEIVRKLSSVPEFSFTAGGDCASCVDLDKVLELKDRATYNDFWKFDHLSIKKTYPAGEGECTSFNYPDCGEITLIEGNEGSGAVTRAFVSLCRWSNTYYKCELGELRASGRGIDD